MPFFAGAWVDSLLYITQSEAGVGVGCEVVLVAVTRAAFVGAGVTFWAAIDSGGMEVAVGVICEPFWLTMLYDDKDEVVTTSDPHAVSKTIKTTHDKDQHTFFTNDNPSSGVLLRCSLV